MRGDLTMRCTFNQLMLVACLSLTLGACSSSGGASPIEGGGTSSGGTSSGGTSNESDSALVSDFDAQNSGGAGSFETVPGSGGDTGGTDTDGVSTTGGGSDIVGAVGIPEIQGEWVTGCLDQGSQFEQQTISVVGARMLTELSAFSDQACTMPVSINADINGSTIQRNATTVPTGNIRVVSLGNAIEVNFYFEQSTVDNKPLPIDGFAGRDDLLARIEYDIVLVQDEALYSGDRNLTGYAGDTAATRPISLDMLTVYSRLP